MLATASRPQLRGARSACDRRSRAAAARGSRRVPLLPPCAAPDGSNADVPVSSPPSPPPASPEDLAAEARLEALERGARRGTGSASAGRASPTAPAPSTSPLAEWKDGSPLPEGFDAMPLPQKLYNLWAGKRGVLYWSSQAAWYSALGLGFGWVVFRFVLPALGVYKLANGLTDAPNL